MRTLWFGSCEFLVFDGTKVMKSTDLNKKTDDFLPIYK